MNADDLVDAVRTEHNTALSRLGSSKTLFADTGGEMTDDEVFAATATSLSHAAAVVEEWADATGGDLGGVVAETATVVDDHAADVAGRLEEVEAGDEPAAVGALADCDGEVARAGGLLGWLLVRDRKTTQLTGYFTGQADPTTASEFRGFGGDYDDLLASLGDALEAACADAADWERAEAAAGDVVVAAYDEYVETLEAMGVNPKPVC